MHVPKQKKPLVENDLPIFGSFAAKHKLNSSHIWLVFLDRVSFCLGSLSVLINSYFTQTKNSLTSWLDNRVVMPPGVMQFGSTEQTCVRIEIRPETQNSKHFRVEKSQPSCHNT